MKKLIITSMAAVFAVGAAHAANGDNPGYIASKGYVDSGLIQKANKSDLAPIKSITDSITSEGTIAKANAAQTAAQVSSAISAATTGMATQTWVGEQGYLTNASISGKADAVATGAGTGTKVTVNDQGIVTATTDAAIADITGLQSALDAKAATADLTTLSGRVDTAESDITALETDKADKATTLAGYGITDAVNTDAIADMETKTNAAETYETKGTAYTKSEADAAFMDSTETATAITGAIAGKADKATTLAGYGITDAMAKVSCSTGQMLLADASGGYSCVNVETGTYTEVVNP